MSNMDGNSGEGSVEYGAYQAKTHFSDLLNQVEQGETIRITRRNKLVAVLCSPEYLRRIENKEVVGAFNRLRKKNPIRATMKEMQEWKNDGRK